MARRFLKQGGLELRLALARLGWLPPVIITFTVLAGTLHFTTIPELRKRTWATQLDLTTTPLPSAESHKARQLNERYTAFRSGLAPLDERGNQLKILFAEANSNGIRLAQGEYRLLPDADGDFQAWQLSLPVKGTYPQIRAFVAAILEKLPAASLDEINFRRDNVKSASVEARLKVTFYLKDHD